jgi:hypothetical protein
VAAVGGHRMTSDGYFEGWQVQSAAIECGIADLMALIRATAEATDNDEYDVRVGIEWAGEQPLTILTRTTPASPTTASTPRCIATRQSRPRLTRPSHHWTTAGLSTTLPRTA